MKIEVRTLQISRNSWTREVQQSYEKKISHFCPTQVKMIRLEKDFLKGVEEKDWVIACDERGLCFSSQDFSHEVNKVFESGKRHLYLFIGGPFGLPKEVMQRADASISLSHFVFNQELALIVTLEQIFRAFTIINHHPYHNE